MADDDGLSVAVTEHWTQLQCVCMMQTGRCGQWHNSHCVILRRKTEIPIWSETHWLSFKVPPILRCPGEQCTVGGFRPLVEQWVSVKSRKDWHQCCHSRGGLFQQWSRDRWWMYNKASHAAKRVELEPPGQVSLYLSPTLTAGPFCNICLRFRTKLNDKVAPVLCHKYTRSCCSVKEMRLSGWMQMIQKGMRYSPALRSAALRCVIKCLCWVTLWSRTC